MTESLKYILLKMEECDSHHNRCDYLLDHSEIDYLLEYIKKLEKEINFLKADNVHVRRIRDNLLIENQELENKLELAKERIAYLERSNDRREDTIISLRDELVEKGE